MSENNGNKSIDQMAKEQAFQGAFVKLGELQKQDGLITEEISKSQAQSLGVLQTIISTSNPSNDDDEYRKILKLARWKNDEQRDKYIKALAQCRITGAVNARQTLLDLIVAQSSGDSGALIKEVIEGLTHTTFTSREEMSRKGKYYDNNGNKNNSTIA